MEELNLKVSASPHVRDKGNTSDIMFDVILALVPATAFGIYQFGSKAAILVIACILAAVLSEYIFQRLIGKKPTIGDFSAALTGLLLALNLPPNLPIWMGVLGSVFAIVVVKQLFGGLGQNFMNPALAARCFLLLSFTKPMTTFIYDGVTSATPLAVLKAGGEVSIKNMFMGYEGGTIGEVSVAALLIGAIYLLVKKIISPKIPLVYIGTFAVCIAIYAAVKDYAVLDFTLAHLCGGGLMLGAWFMATDYVTSPITSKGKIVFGVILGLLTFVLRIFGGSAEGVSYAIIISNLFVPLIEKVTVPKSFGAGADEAKEKKNEKRETEEVTEKAVDETVEEASKDNAEATTEEFTPVKLKMDGKGIAKAIAAIFIITAVMGAALGVVYDITKGPIEEAAVKAKEEAYAEIFPEMGYVEEAGDENTYKAMTKDLADLGYEGITINEVLAVVNKDNMPNGLIIILTTSNGYGGDIQMVIGIDMACNIKGISFLSISETVGLGMEVKDEDFLGQFYDKGVTQFNYTKTGATGDNQIDAVSGATITTSAVVDGVNAALRVFVNIFGN